MTREEAINIIKYYIDLPIRKDDKKALDMAIKALEQEGYYKDLAQSYEKTIVKLTEAIAEQQPIEDSVSRQAVVQWLENATDDSIEHAIDSNLEFIPPVTSTRGWISVSERLPQMREYVLCCEKDKVFIGCMVFEYDGVPVFSKSDYKHFYVTAWMPLPKPYKAEMESD